ncbi:EpsD family peptidyl-prolyl cis-trans isomerase [Herbaspirillum huttiense]|uniref:peptidylprolyl isomerase n=2 Tax=Herbaspirillum huttiense TaxID=863372 RepID=A0AAJ2H5P7_9BURK|nr:EpsD family peptidyl-prolyl cis-trans isomerase [Herbaspirillum huttiense]MDR9834281.1 EpsD family peptidyl-prolyl cis-trans isomerase [Herbaspirillum huttiense]UWE18548.1 EpsD family peptidyl-prolyl cis-trans isomerase [Herbaspirillum huttiense]
MAVKALVSTMLFVALSACGEKKSASSTSQVVAIVDGQEITIHQVNNELAKTGGSQVTKQLLDGLVARQLLVNAAKKDKLDADPAVLADMERARNLVLAQSYVASKLKSPARPLDQEVEDLYRKNPDWFAQRKQYEFGQLVIARSNLTPELNTLMDQPGKRMDEVVAWLDSHRIQYARQQVVKTSADLPPQMNASLKTMERGALFVVLEGQTAILTSLQDVKNAPLSLAVATPQIIQYLVTQKQNQASEQLVERLKGEAKIEYSEQAKSFTDLAAQANASGAEAASQKGAANDPESIKKDVISRGVSGFK